MQPPVVKHNFALNIFFLQNSILSCSKSLIEKHSASETSAPKFLFPIFFDGNDDDRWSEKKSEKAKLRNKQEIGLSEADVESFFFFIKKES